MGKNGIKMGVLLSFFYKFAENKEFFQGWFLPYKLGIETPRESSKKLCRTFAQYLLTGSTHLLFALEFLNFSPLVGSSRNNLAK